MADIREFLEARIAEDEAYAAQARGQHYGWVDNWRAETMQGTKTESVIYAHAFRFSPERLLAECVAKRAIIEQAEEATGLDMCVDNDRLVGRRDMDAEPYCGDVILRALASVYADHPDYQQEWAA